MRPRPDAAENGSAAVSAQRRIRASMRPRPDAAENRIRSTGTSWCHVSFNEAAARCRGKHTESVFRPIGFAIASMRPRPDAAENVDSQRRGFYLAPRLQ